MTNTPVNEGDWGETELDPQERQDAETFLDDPTSGDSEPWSPPDRQPRGAEYAEIEGAETLDQRVWQEVPDDAGDNEGDDELLGGDDPDAIPANHDVLGGPWRDEDDEINELAGGSPETSAMHVVDDDEVDEHEDGD